MYWKRRLVPPSLDTLREGTADTNIAGLEQSNMTWYSEQKNRKYIFGDDAECLCPVISYYYFESRDS
jgi:hypothetical protein